MSLPSGADAYEWHIHILPHDSNMQDRLMRVVTAAKAFAETTDQFPLSLRDVQNVAWAELCKALEEVEK